MKRLLTSVLTVATIVAVGGALICAFLEGRTELQREREREQPVTARKGS